MKLPEYSLKQKVTFMPPDGGPDDMVEFLPGTLIFPFWNETLLPSHIKDKMREGATKPLKYGFDSKPSKSEGKMIMCIIGRHWVAVPASYIRSSQ